ncbi:MAG: hypothetical protein HFF50_05910 [Lawsonibacter sp.]|nr:hypothetical protein [Lawsonibacter sp.]
MKLRYIVAAAVLLSLTLSSCSPQPGGAASSLPVEGAASVSSSQGSSQDANTPPAAFRMTQEGSVRNEKFREREEFADFLAVAESSFLIPGLNQAMTPQGITFSENTGLVYITSYAIQDTPSAISAVDLTTGEIAAEYYLFQPDGTPFTSHVGGIAAAEGYLYVSAKLDNDGSYSIAVLPMDRLPTEGSHDIPVEEIISQPVSPSFLNYSLGTLWVGNFYHLKGDYNLSKEMNFTTPTADGEAGCYILGYAVPEGGKIAVPDGEKYPVPVLTLVAPDKIQGVTALADRQNITIWLSQSYWPGGQLRPAVLPVLPGGDA